MRRREVRGLLTWILGLSLAAGVTAQGAPPVVAERSAGVSREDCFPLERLPASLRPQAEAMLLQLMDTEGLYTVIGGIKPMSSGFWSARVDVESPQLAEVIAAETILRQFRVGDQIVAGVQPFSRAFEGRRFFEGLIFHRGSYERAVSARPEVFGGYGIHAGTPPLQAVLMFESGSTSRRFRAYGHLFGYPDVAVDFFARSADAQKPGDPIVPRDFRQIPVFARETGAFVYAVAKGAPETEEDRALRERSLRILAKYRSLRAQYVGEGKPGIVALIRDWMDDGSGRLSPETAYEKTQKAGG